MYSMSDKFFVDEIIDFLSTEVLKTLKIDKILKCLYYKKTVPWHNFTQNLHLIKINKFVFLVRTQLTFQIRVNLVKSFSNTLYIKHLNL